MQGPVLCPWAYARHMRRHQHSPGALESLCNHACHPWASARHVWRRQHSLGALESLCIHACHMRHCRRSDGVLGSQCNLACQRIVVSPWHVPGTAAALETQCMLHCESARAHGPEQGEGTKLWWHRANPVPQLTVEMAKGRRAVSGSTLAGALFRIPKRGRLPCGAMP